MSQDDLFITAIREWVENSMHRSFHAFIRQNRDSDLSLSQVNTLMRLYHHGSDSVHDLADHLGITMAAVSQLLDQLIAAELVSRSENPDDRRMKLLVLTDKGKLLVEKSMNNRHAWLAELSQVLSDSEKAQLLPAIKLLNERTRDLFKESDRPCKPEPK